MKGTVNRNLSLNRNYTKGGEIIFTEWYNSVLRDQQGNILTILSLVHNVTERKKAEETLNRSYKEIRRLTEHLQNIREEERTSIAREIHDELGQQLSVLKMNISWLSDKLNVDDATVKQKIQDFLGLLNVTAKTVRRISSELRPILLDDLGLTAAMEWHLVEFKKRAGIQFLFNAPEGELQLANPVKTGLFRIFQESLTNVATHSSAKMVKVELQQKNGQLILIIEDNGKGFDKQKAVEEKTLGILGMKERAVIIGATCEIRSVPGKGTTVRVVLAHENA
jgi:signal transduction histidine kinase